MSTVKQLFNISPEELTLKKINIIFVNELGSDYGEYY